MYAGNIYFKFSKDLFKNENYALFQMLNELKDKNRQQVKYFKRLAVVIIFLFTSLNQPKEFKKVVNV